MPRWPSHGVRGDLLSAVVAPYGNGKLKPLVRLVCVLGGLERRVELLALSEEGEWKFLRSWPEEGVSGSLRMKESTQADDDFSKAVAMSLSR